MKKITLILLAVILLAVPATAKEVTFCWDAPSGCQVDHYNVYIGYSYQELMANIQIGNYYDTTTELCYCVYFDETQYPGFFVAVSTVDTENRESKEWIEFQNLGWYLYGNIVDTYNDHTVSWNEAEIDNDDYFTFYDIYAAHAYLYDVPTSGLSCGDPGLASQPLPTQLQWSDLDSDLNISYDDFLLFMDRYNYFWQLPTK